MPDGCKSPVRREHERRTARSQLAAGLFYARFPVPQTDTPMARPSKYSPKIADAICERLISGRSLRSICADDDMPHVVTVLRWLRERDEFRSQYALAREAQADTIVDEILEIADDARNDWMERHGEDDAGWSINGDHIQRSRLRVDARKWMASKLQPKKYGDKVQLDHGGEVKLIPSIRINGKSG